MRSFSKIKNIFLITSVLFVVVFGAYGIRIYFEIQDKLKLLIDYNPQIATQIFDRKDRLVANVFEEEFRFYAKFDEIPPRMVEALLAVEDTLFFEHDGINFNAIFRATLKNALARKYLEGGSTLTQQLVKNVALSRDKTLDRKFKEAILSYQIEKRLTKEQILERYFNETFFGHGYYGIKTAAQGYFNKELNQLTLKEIAMLVGLPKAPSVYDPTRNLDLSLSRANDILERMKKLGWITQTEFSESTTEIPQVYSQSLTQNKAPYVVDEALRQLSYIPDLKTGGYIIKLNIDLDYQELARESLAMGYDRIISKIEENENKNENKQDKAQMQEENTPDTTLNGAMVVTENSSGKILALVGGVDYTKSAFNRATQAKRQFGSSIKPFIYQIAFDSGYAPSSKIPDVARSYDKESETKNKKNEYWRPQNFSRSFSGVVTLKRALMHSLNLATINLVELIGFDNLYENLESFGFNNLPKDMSIVLGSASLSPLDAAKEYSIFSNYGTLVHPSLIHSIESPNGEITTFQTQKEFITQPAQTYLVTSILQDVIKSGTGRRAKVKRIELAGKTGTSNNNIDAWFCGFSPSIQVIVWYGRDNNAPIGKHESGSVVAAPAFGYFFENLLKIEPKLKREFKIPKGVFEKHINGETFFYTEVSNPREEGVLEEIQMQENLIF